MSKESPNHISVASKAPAVPGAKGEKPEPKPVPIRTGKKEGFLIEKDIKNNLLNKINDLYKNNDYEKLSYLYYEYFNKIENNKEEIYNNLIKSINNFNYKHNVLYNILKLSEQK